MARPFSADLAVRRPPPDLLPRHKPKGCWWNTERERGSPPLLVFGKAAYNPTFGNETRVLSKLPLTPRAHAYAAPDSTLRPNGMPLWGHRQPPSRPQSADAALPRTKMIALLHSAKETPITVHDLAKFEAIMNFDAVQRDRYGRPITTTAPLTEKALKSVTMATTAPVLYDPNKPVSRPVRAAPSVAASTTTNGNVRPRKWRPSRDVGTPTIRERDAESVMNAVAAHRARPSRHTRRGMVVVTTANQTVRYTANTATHQSLFVEPANRGVAHLAKDGADNE